jgi:hypothetical protein
MSLYSMYKMDSTKEQEGIIVEMPVNEEGAYKGKAPRFKVARMAQNNPLYTKELERASRPYRRLIEMDQLPIETDRKVTLEVFLAVILLGWENVQDEKGAALPFNHENARKLMNDLPDLYVDLRTQAMKASLFRAEQLENEAKN